MEETQSHHQPPPPPIRLTVFGGREILSTTPITPSPLWSMGVETLCFGGVSQLRGEDDFTVSRGGCTGKFWVTTSFPQWFKWYTVPFFVSGQTYKISKGSNNYCSHCIFKKSRGPKTFAQYCIFVRWTFTLDIKTYRPLKQIHVWVKSD